MKETCLLRREQKEAASSRWRGGQTSLPSLRLAVGHHSRAILIIDGKLYEVIVLGVRNLKLKSVVSSQGAGRLAKLQGQRAGLPLEKIKLRTC